MLLDEISLVLALQVNAPFYRILELLAAFFKNLDALCVGESYELDSEHALEPFNKSVVVFVIKELDVLHAVVQSILHEIFHELLFEVHGLIHVVERHFRLDHPELCKMSRSVGVLCPECRTESIDFTYSCSSELTFELAAHGKTCLLAEEVLAEVHFAVVHRNFGEVECRHLEHVACTFRVRLCNERSMEIYESLALEERVDGKRHGIPDSENGTESVGSQPHVSNCSQIFE